MARSGRFAAAHLTEHDAEAAAGEPRSKSVSAITTPSQNSRKVPCRTLDFGRKYLNSYSPEGSWFVMGMPTSIRWEGPKAADHASPYIIRTCHWPSTACHSNPAPIAEKLAGRHGCHARIASGHQRADAFCRRALTEAIAPPHRGSGAESQR